MFRFVMNPGMFYRLTPTPMALVNVSATPSTDLLTPSFRSDKSGARVHELSAPLAEAGISILYLSSYLCDFMLVSPPRTSNREVLP